MLTDVKKASAYKGYSWRRWVKARRWPLLSAWCALLVVLGGTFEVQAQGQLSRSLERLSTEIVDLFPKVEGDVVKVQGNEAFITLGAPDNIREGMELTVVRKGEEFKHPLTGVALGRFEEDIGVIIISKVSETYSSGNVRLAKATVNPRTGDRVRITKGKIPLALLPLRGDLPSFVPREELLERLRMALEQTGRFQVTAADNVRVYLAEKGIQPEQALSQDILARMAEDLRVTYAVASRTRQVGNESVLEVSLTGLALQRTLLTSSAILAEPEAVARAPESRGGPPDSRDRPEVRAGVFKEPRKAPPGYRLDLSTLDLGKTMKELISLPFLVTSMDVCGVIAEGSEDILVTDGKKVLMYQLAGEQVEFIDQYVPGVASRLLSVQCADIDKNPGQEIIVNQYIHNALNTAILTFRNGRLHPLQEHIDVLLVAVDTNGDGVNDAVWGTAYDLTEFFTTGRAALYAFDNGKLRRQEQVEVPRVYRATGVSLADLAGDGKRDLVMIDDSRYLRVFRGRPAIVQEWRSGRWRL